MKTIRWITGAFALLIILSAFVWPTPSTPDVESLPNTKLQAVDFQDFLDYFPLTALPFEVTLEAILPDELKQQSSSTKGLKSFEELKKTETKLEDSFSQTEKTGSTISLKTLEAEAKSRKKSEGKSEVMAAYLPEAKHGRFSRMGPPEIVPVGSFPVNDNLVAVVYSTQHRFIKQSKNIKLVLFSKKGELLKEEQLAFCNPRETQIGKIDRNGLIELTHYTNEWEKDVNEFGPVDNTLLAFHKEKVEFLKIGKDGQLETLTQHPGTERASLD